MFSGWMYRTEQLQHDEQLFMFSLLILLCKTRSLSPCGTWKGKEDACWYCCYL